MKYRIKNESSCFSCGAEKDDIRHTLLKCKEIKKFWRRLVKEYNENKNLNLAPTDSEILLGLIYSCQDSNCTRINIIFILAKKFIYQQRKDQKHVKIGWFLLSLKKQLFYLEQVAESVNEIDEFTNRWKNWI